MYQNGSGIVLPEKADCCAKGSFKLSLQVLPSQICGTIHAVTKCIHPGMKPIYLGSVNPPDISSVAEKEGSTQEPFVCRDRVMVINDIERDGYTFTDGCGIISHRLTVKLYPAWRKTFVHGHHYKHSVFQVRIPNCQSVFLACVSLAHQIRVCCQSEGLISISDITD